MISTLAALLLAAAPGPGSVELAVEDAAFAAKLSTALTFDGWKIVEKGGDYVLRGRLVVTPGPTGFGAVGDVKLVVRSSAAVAVVLPVSVIDRTSAGDALDVASKRIVVKLREATAAAAPGKDVTVELEGLAFSDVEDMQLALENLRVTGITRGALDDGVQVFTLKTTMTPAEVAKALSGSGFKKRKLVIVTVKAAGTVRARLEK